MQFLDLDGLKVFWSKIKSLVSTTEAKVGSYTVNGTEISQNPQISLESVLQVNNDATTIPEFLNGILIGDKTNSAVSIYDDGVSWSNGDNKRVNLAFPIDKSGTFALDSDVAAKIDKGSLATVNGTSLENGVNISIDLTLFKVVTTLPTTDIDTTKIYLVKSAETTTGNLYTEYIYADGAWEKLGEYKSDVDLSDYAKTADINPYLLKNLAASVNATGATLRAVNVNGTTYSSVSLAGATASQAGLMLPAEYTWKKNMEKSLKDRVFVDSYDLTPNATNVKVILGGVMFGDTGTSEEIDGSNTIPAATTSLAGVMSAVDKTKLDGITTGATADSAISADEINALS